MTKQEVIDQLKSVQSEEELTNLIVSLSQDELTEGTAATVAKWLLPLVLMHAPSSMNADAAIKAANAKLSHTHIKSERQIVASAIKKYSQKYTVNPRVIEKMLDRESSFHLGDDVYDANVVGDLNNTLGPSYGPGQIKVPTAKEIYTKFPETGINASLIDANRLKNDITFNVKTMCKLMQYYYKQFGKVKNSNKRWALAATAYNRGITKTKKTQTSNIYGKSVAMKETKSLFKEFMNAGEYVNYTDMYSKSEVPLKSQLQSLLANLPDEEQLAAFEGELRTLKVTMNAIKFESPSMQANVKHVADDVIVIREKLRSVISSIQQMMRDMGLKSPYEHEGDDNTAPEIEQGSIEGIGIREEYVGKWNGLSKGKNPSDFDKDALKKGVKVEMEHVKGAKGKKDVKLAMHICMDHLTEDPQYYEKLAKMEKK